MPKPKGPTLKATTVNTTALPRRRAETRPIGPFAQLVLCAVKTIPAKKCYGTNVEEFLTNKLGELVDQAQVYVTLRKLQEGHFVIGRPSAEPAKNGHRVTNYTITPSGRDAMQHAATFYSVVAEAPDWE